MKHDKSCRLGECWPQANGSDTPQESPPPSREDYALHNEPKPKWIAAIDEAIDRFQSGQGSPLTPHGEAIAAGDGTLHGAIDYWQERALKAEADAFQMAAGQCCVRHGLTDDGNGHQYCDIEKQRDDWKMRATNIQGEANVLVDIIRDAYEVIKTIEGESTDEEESLLQLRRSMALAFSTYNPIAKTTVESGAQ